MDKMSQTRWTSEENMNWQSRGLAWNSKSLSLENLIQEPQIPIEPIYVNKRIQDKFSSKELVYLNKRKQNPFVGKEENIS